MALPKEDTGDLTDADTRNKKLGKFDARGIQTLFRTLSRNHYTLLKMVDTKARIMLTVNSIISSLLLGALFMAPRKSDHAIGAGTRILIICSLISMVFAILSMLPHRYLGKSYRKSGYRGTLYAGSFAARSLEEFKAEFDRILKKGQNIYDEMTNDLYFLGKVIAVKQKLLLLSFAVFLVGVIITIVHALRTGAVNFI